MNVDFFFFRLPETLADIGPLVALPKLEFGQHFHREPLAVNYHFAVPENPVAIIQKIISYCQFKV